MSNNKNNRKTVEQRVADTALQQPLTLEIGGRKVTVAPPTLGTLIMASAAVSQMPEVDMTTGNVLSETLRVAKDSSAVAELAATLIVGGRGSQGRGVVRWLWQWRIGCMKRWILERVSPSELRQAMYTLFSEMQVADFFGLIAFLGTANVTKPTKATTTASGQ